MFRPYWRGRMRIKARCILRTVVLCGSFTAILFTWYWLMNSRAADALFVEIAESTDQMNQSRPKATPDLFTVAKNHTEESVTEEQSSPHAPTKQLSLDYEKQTEEPLARRGPPQHCESWCRRGAGVVGSQPPYFLTAVLEVRIYYVDLAKLTTREMYQWLQYLRYAGVEHVYVYDEYRFQNESQLSALEGFIEEGYVTYTDWHDVAWTNGNRIEAHAKTQESAYKHCLSHYAKDSMWQTAIDIDEYPFSVTDTEQNFMRRFVEDFSSKNPHVSQITMQNYLFLGKPLNDTLHPLLASRVWRRTKTPANALVKPIYKPEDVKTAGVHRNVMKSGSSSSIKAPDEGLRMNHYWGARLQNWGEDTPEILAKTTEDLTMRPIVEAVLDCEACLPEKNMLRVSRWN